MLSLGLELGHSAAVSITSGMTAKGLGPARVLYAGEVRQGLLELRVTGLISPDTADLSSSAPWGPYVNCHSSIDNCRAPRQKVGPP